MTKRLLKKYLAAFGYTLTTTNYIDVASGQTMKDGEIKSRPIYHRNDRSAQEQARVLPALLKAPIGRSIKAELARQVGA